LAGLLEITLAAAVLGFIKAVWLAPVELVVVVPADRVR
jgi:hypothetical protein